MFPSQDKVALKKDSKARNAMRLAAMFATSGIEEEAPWLAASNKFWESLHQENKRKRVHIHVTFSHLKEWAKLEIPSFPQYTIIRIILLELSGWSLEEYPV